MRLPKICILAPHCDDAMLSLGGFMLLNKPNIHVVDIFATTAWTTLSGSLSTKEITTMNQSEELRVMKIAGASVELIETPEALLRGYNSWNETALKTSDILLAEELWVKIRGILISNKEIYCPIAPGSHVDHRIVRQIIMNHAIELIHSGSEIYFYEDLPYAWYGGLDEALAEVRAQFDLTEIKYDISNFIELKMDTLSIYRSQLAKSDLEKVREYAVHIGGGQANEKVWKLQLR